MLKTLVKRAGAAISSLADSAITILTIGSPSITTQQGLNTAFASAGVTDDSTGAITDAGGATVDLAARDVFLHATDAHDGVLYSASIAASAGVAIPTNTTRWIGIEYNAGSPQYVVKTSDSWDSHTEFAMGSVVNESDVLHVLNNPSLAVNVGAHIIHRLYDTERFERAERIGGGILGEKGTREVTVTAAEFYDRLNEFTYTDKDTSVADTFDSYSSGGLESAADTAWDNLNYDNAGTLTAMTASKYANLWFYAEMDDALVCVYGTAEYVIPATAAEEAPPSVLPDRLVAHGRLIGRMIFQKSAATAEEIESAFDTTFSGLGATSHNDTAGIQGGAANDYFHMTSAEYLASNITVSASDPTINDDSGAGYVIGNTWINTTSDAVFKAADVTVGAAVWQDLTGGGWVGTATSLLDMNGNDIQFNSGDGILDANGDIVLEIIAIGGSPTSHIKMNAGTAGIATSSPYISTTWGVLGMSAELLFWTNRDIYFQGSNRIKDLNSAIIMDFNIVSSAVNYLQVGNNTTGNAPTLAALGGDANIDAAIVPKGTAAVDLSAGGVILNRVSKSAAYTTTKGDRIIGVDTSGGAVTITLGSATAINGFVQKIQDEGGAAGASNITIATEGAETINGAASVTISANYGKFEVHSDGSNFFA